MLAVVQHHEDAQRAQAKHQRWHDVLRLNGQAELRRDRAGDELRVRHCTEVHEADTAVELFEQCVRRGHGHGRLADPAGTDDRDEAIGDQIRSEGADDLIATDHARQHRRQDEALSRRATGIFRKSRRSGCCGFAPNGCDKTVALAHDVGDIPLPTLAVAIVLTECLAQAVDVHAQIARVDDEVAPDARQQLLVADDIARPLDEHQQNVERTSAERERNAVFLEHARARKKPKRSKGNDVALGGSLPLAHDAAPAGHCGVDEHSEIVVTGKCAKSQCNGVYTA